MVDTHHSGRPLLTTLLRDVSRSFYLTLRILPRAVREQFGLAYLLARTTDTIADTELVPIAERFAALEQLRRRILAGSGDRLDFSRFVSALTTGASPAERVLLERVEDALAVLQRFRADDQQLIRAVLDTITSGQALDLQRFGAASAGCIVALETDSELDDYTYRVAGCVGEFWTRLCRAHLFPAAPLDDGWLLETGVRFGKGLQLVNILRDLPQDLRMGRCYLPSERLAHLGLKPAELLDPASESAARPFYRELLDAAASHLAAGWKYTNALPRGQVRLRLGCAWPLLIGKETVKRLRAGNVLEPANRIKITRRDVQRIMVRSVFWYPFPQRWRALF